MSFLFKKTLVVRPFTNLNNHIFIIIIVQCIYSNDTLERENEESAEIKSI